MLGVSGELAPGPTMHEMAQGAPPLKDRFDMLHDTNQELGQSVETLWRLRQSWGMQRVERAPWNTRLARPKVLIEAPSRSYRTNVTHCLGKGDALNVHIPQVSINDLTASAALTASDHYEVRDVVDLLRIY